MTPLARQRMDSVNKGARLETMKLRVAVYARVSTESEEQKKSIQHQIEIYRAMIEENPNWQYAGLYSDEGITGTRMDIREQFRTMLDDARLGKIDLVITKSVSRFSRNLKDFLVVVDLLTDLGVIIQFDQENCLSCNPRDYFSLHMFALGASMEASSAQERTRVAFQHLIQRGAVFGNSNILGYTKNQCRLVIDETEAPVVRAIFDLFVHKRMGLRAIRRELRRRGLTRSDGSFLGETTIANVLDNPKYKGFFCGGKTEKSADHKRRISLPPDRWVIYEEASIPAIVPPELWDAAARLRKRRRAKFQQSVSVPCNEGKYRYSGKIVSGGAEGVHYTRILNRYKGQNREGWQPRNYRSAQRPGTAGPTIYSEELDAVIKLVLWSVLGNPQPIVDDLIQRYSQVLGNAHAEDRIAALKKKQAETERKRSRLLDLYERGGLTYQEFLDRDIRHRQEIHNQENAILALEKTKRSEQELQNALAALRKEIERNIEEAPPGKELIDTLVRQIIVCQESTHKRILLDLEINAGFRWRFTILREPPGEGDHVLLAKEKFCICCK